MMKDSLKKIGCVLIVLLYFKQQSMAGGYAAFEERTPYHNLLVYDGSSSYLVYLEYSDSNSSTIGNSNTKENAYFKQFYFYKGYIVGRADSLFFVANERKPTVLKFTDSVKFEAFLIKNNLKPKLWTRWYDHYYDEANFKYLLLFAFFLFPITLLIISLYLYCFVNVLKGKKVKFYKAKMFYLIALPSFILFVYLFQTFPQSI
ncbi:hypothetical protein [Pedobacter sp. Hv1]|uniref:hypothetical protein n=1 Tax=Pedobacter sp. Hv1 TaxID=1740090 RepID=UPI0006D8BF56|nr:hypothetical protein [Pedobacter sp. Hv1]KQC02797.1 hypothetical protein AQF98_04275 [Pedobacter sp. Hv1]